MASTRTLVAPVGPDAVARAAALGAAVEAAGGAPLVLRPLADGGAGTTAVLLPALGGETAGVVLDGAPRGYALLEGGTTALVEATDDPAATGALVAAVAARGALVVLLCAGDAGDPAAASARALHGAGGLRGAALVVLADASAPGGLARALRDGAAAVLEDGAALVADLLDLDGHLADADVVLTAGDGPAAAELVRRCARAGVPLERR